MYKIIYFLGKFSRRFRKYYNKKFNNYPWGVLMFIDDYGTFYDNDTTKLAELTQEEFNNFFKNFR